MNRRTLFETRRQLFWKTWIRRKKLFSLLAIIFLVNVKLISVNLNVLMFEFFYVFDAMSLFITEITLT